MKFYVWCILVFSESYPLNSFDIWSYEGGHVHIEAIHQASAWSKSLTQLKMP